METKKINIPSELLEIKALDHIIKQRTTHLLPAMIHYK